MLHSSDSVTVMSCCNRKSPRPKASTQSFNQILARIRECSQNPSRNVKLGTERPPEQALLASSEGTVLAPHCTSSEVPFKHKNLHSIILRSLYPCTRFQVLSSGMQSFATTTSSTFCSNMPKLRSLIAHSPHDLGVLIHVPNELVPGSMSHQSYQCIAGSTPASTRSRPIAYAARVL